MPNPETYNLRQLINNHFFDRDQTKEILENFVTVNNGVLHVGLPEPTNIALTTPNNAITTADMGTLKAKVTGASNVNCYGVPVEFVNKKTQKILGYGLTDLNGEVYHNFRLDDADIFDVQARLSQDYLFNDFGMLNNTHTWNNNSNIVREIYEDHTKIYLDDDTSYGYLCSPVLSGFVDIDFKVKLNDGAITDTFCGLFATDSSGTVSGALNGFNLGQLGLTSADIGRWVDFHIGVLDDTIVLLCKDTGAMVKLSHTCPSYYIFSFALTGTLTSLDFKGVKINKCSDDLTMFVKDKNNLFSFNLWACGDYSSYLGFNNNGGAGYISANKSNEWSSNGNYSAKTIMDSSKSGYIRFNLTDVSNLLGKTIKFSCDLKTESPLNMRIFYKIGADYQYVTTDIPRNVEGNFEVEYFVNDNVSQLLFNINHVINVSTEDIIFYTDNWCLTII